MAAKMNDASVVSVNVGVAKPIAAKSGLTGIDKVPIPGAVGISAPGRKGVGGSGVEGDAVCDRENHGGDDQAVYVYAREDYEVWERRLGRALRPGVFGDNLTTVGIDVNAARVGERWKVGSDVVLTVTGPRIPCRTFAVWLDRAGWTNEFARERRPGAYLKVIEPGAVKTGDVISVMHRPVHNITVEVMFRALMGEPALLPTLFEAGDDLSDEARSFIDERLRGRQSS